MSDEASSAPVDPASVTIEAMEPHVGSKFVFKSDSGGPVELELLQTIDEHREAAGGSGGPSEFRRPFSLVLQASDDTVHPQAIRELTHSELGKILRVIYEDMGNPITLNTDVATALNGGDDTGAVPEPSSFALLGLGFLGMAGSRRRRKGQSAA